MILKLMYGIQQYQGKTLKKLAELFAQLSQGQNPDTLFITCSDSRIDPNAITRSKPGDLFIQRNVGNIVPPYGVAGSEGAAIEYAVEVLKVKEIIICGHSQCGAMQGLLTPNLETTLPAVATWLTHARPVLDKIEKRFDIGNTKSDPNLKLKATIEYNILTQIEHLMSYPAIMKRLNQQEITIHGWYYEIKKGEVYIYEPNQKQFLPLEDAFNAAFEEKIATLTENIAMQYLQSQAQPQTATDYLKLMHLFNQLKFSIKPIWAAIKDKLVEGIWPELKFMFSDKNDTVFIELINNTINHKLKNLDSLRKEIMTSAGYHDYCHQQLLSSNFFITNSVKSPMLASNNPVLSDNDLTSPNSLP
ncbi:carbonic anhydrase [Legionella busanensis]|uniref:carbonic anhydrase n=1 Tax=Legionella busanensis TaxID=190655 RepID=A0A378JR66_9GAMM|nr:carbonic anhydrase [Legionella busanensis]STX52390.1 carbonic anhydrase [Legionella busanensis]